MGPHLAEQEAKRAKRAEREMGTAKLEAEAAGKGAAKAAKAAKTAGGDSPGGQEKDEEDPVSEDEPGQAEDAPWTCFTAAEDEEMDIETRIGHDVVACFLAAGADMDDPVHGDAAKLTDLIDLNDDADMLTRSDPLVLKRGWLASPAAKDYGCSHCTSMFHITVWFGVLGLQFYQNACCHIISWHSCCRVGLFLGSVRLQINQVIYHPLVLLWSSDWQWLACGSPHTATPLAPTRTLYPFQQLVM